MKAGIRIILCTVLIALAATMATMTIAGFTARRESVRAESGYVLGAADGNIAVFSAGDRKTPLQVTEIELATLREADQALLRQGLTVETREELMALLEDLGS